MMPPWSPPASSTNPARVGVGAEEGPAAVSSPAPVAAAAAEAVEGEEEEAFRLPPFSSPSFFPKGPGAGAVAPEEVVVDDDGYDGDDFYGGGPGPHAGHWWHAPKQALPRYQEPVGGEEARWLEEEEEVQPMEPKAGSGLSYDAVLARLAAAQRKGEDGEEDKEDGEQEEGMEFRRPLFSSPSFFPKGSAGGGGKGKRRKQRQQQRVEVVDDGYDGDDHFGGGGGGEHEGHWWHAPKQALATAPAAGGGGSEPWMAMEEEGELEPLAPKGGAEGGGYDTALVRLQAAARRRGEERKRQQTVAVDVVAERDQAPLAPTEEALQREQLQVGLGSYYGDVLIPLRSHASD